MALKDILVHVDRSDAGMTRMRLAADLAARHAAHLSVLHIREHSVNQERRLKAGELGLIRAAEAGSDGVSVENQIEAASRTLHAALRQLDATNGLRTDWCDVVGNTAKVVIQRSRYADLTIVGHDLTGDEDLPNEYSFAESILFASGRPLLIIPSNLAQATLGQTVAVAWNGSRPAARALSDALPLIERAGHTILLSADPRQLERSGSLPIESVMANIGRHTETIRMVTIEGTSHSLGDRLQDQAMALGADLLVAGAFGQPRLWEKMLGGTTQDLLARMRMPILMSH